ncbi:MAG: InlB B-repeat-containing protein [Spirochaetes bacterium]|nr:InlB B-repeat-containing protein [Spirochaetota bacterium]
MKMKRNMLFKRLALLTIKVMAVSCMAAFAITLAGCDNNGGDDTYTITYNGNGNTGGKVPVDSKEYEEGDTVIILGNTGGLVKTGYIFAGWNTAADGSGTTYSQGQSFTMGAKDAVLYVKWTAQATYFVTYEGNGNTGGAPPVDSTNYLPGQTVTVAGPGTLQKIGYAFNGWNTAANGSGISYVAGGTFLMGADDVTLWAQWTELPTYTVTYEGNDNDGGEAPVDETHYLQGQTVIVLANTGNLSKSGYAFAGWNTAADGSGISYIAGERFLMSADDVTLWAQWTELPTYAVTYNGNGNTAGDVPVDPMDYLAGQTVTVLGQDSLVKTGSTFSGWNTAANGSGTPYAAGDTFVMGSGDVTLWAQWTALPAYTVAYNGNGNSGGVAPVDSTRYLTGQTVAVLGQGSLVKIGCIFNGWNTVADGSGTPYAAGDTFIMGYANMTLYAIWVQSDAPYTEIKKGFDAAGVQVTQRETEYTSQADYAVTYDPGQYFGYLHYIVTTSEGSSDIQPAYIVSTKFSNGAGTNGTWMDSDDVEIEYVLNRFDDYGRIYETNVYRDFYRARRLGYSRYTLNSDGTYNKILFYTNSGVLTGSVCFTNENGLMKQLDYWSGDASGDHVRQVVLTYDASNRLTTVLQLLNDCSSGTCTGLKNSQRNVYEYSGSNIQASKMRASMWLGYYWYSMGTIDYSLNASGTLVLTASGSLMSEPYSSVTTYNALNFYDTITTYSDKSWDTESGYFEFSYQ